MWIPQQVFSTNNLFDASRYLVAKDSVNAKKVALLAAVLMFAGAFAWFLPPMATAVMGIDLAVHYPTLVSKATDDSYLVFVDAVMPVGMVGIMMAALFSATISSIDSGLNRSAGIMVLNFYNTIIKPEQDHGAVMGLALSGGIVPLIGCLLKWSARDQPPLVNTSNVTESF